MSSNSRKRKRQNSENSAPKHVPVSYANNVVKVPLNPKGHLSLSLLRSTFSEDVNRLYLRPKTAGGSPYIISLTSKTFHPPEENNGWDDFYIFVLKKDEKLSLKNFKDFSKEIEGKDEDGVTSVVISQKRIASDECDVSIVVTSQKRTVRDECDVNSAETSQRRTASDDCGAASAVTTQRRTSSDECGTNSAVTSQRRIASDECGATFAVLSQKRTASDECGANSAITTQKRTICDECGVISVVTSQKRTTSDECGANSAVTTQKRTICDECGVISVVASQKRTVNDGGSKTSKKQSQLDEESEEEEPKVINHFDRYEINDRSHPRGNPSEKEIVEHLKVRCFDDIFQLPAFKCFSPRPMRRRSFFDFQNIFFDFLRRTILMIPADQFRSNFLFDLRKKAENSSLDQLPGCKKYCSCCDNCRVTIRHLFTAEHISNYQYLYNKDPPHILYLCRQVIQYR